MNSHGETHTYALNYTGATNPMKTYGGFDGGGQRPVDVNRFLRYSSPSSSRTYLASGTTSFRLAISYDASVDPLTFKADLNGVDITSMFSPKKDSSEVINIPVTTGSNTLLLNIDGTTTSGRVATDTDRLVLIVP